MPNDNTPLSSTPNLPRRGRGLLWLLALPPLVIGAHALANNDLPLHLAIGEWITTYGTLPATDPFSHTAGSRPWVPHEWLAALLFYGIERVAGDGGLIVGCMFLSALLACIWGLAMRQLGVRTVALLVVTPWVWLLAGRRLMLRPHLFALILPFALWWVLLKARGDRRWWIGVPPLLILWGNLHGSFLLGIAIVALELLFGPCPWAATRPTPGARSSRQHSSQYSQTWRLRGLLLCTLPLLLLTQVHVYFHQSWWAGVEHALGLVSDPVFMRQVQEWKPPFSGANTYYRQTYAFWGSLPWLFAVLAGIIFEGTRVKKLGASYLIFVGLTLYLFLRHQRFLALWVLASTPLFPWELLRAFVTPRLSALARRRVAIGVAVLAAVFFFYPGYPVLLEQPFRRPGWGWARYLPIEIIENLANSEASGPVWCEYEDGGVFAWLSRGRLQPSIDSRNSVYGAEFFSAHNRALVQDTPLRRALLDRVILVLLRNDLRNRSNLVAQLRQDPRFREVPIQRLDRTTPLRILFARQQAAGD